MKNEFILKTLLSRVAKGDYASFRELFDIQYATVNRFVGYFLPNKEDREEVVSEVFCILWKRREELIEDGLQKKGVEEKTLFSMVFFVSFCKGLIISF